MDVPPQPVAADRSVAALHDSIVARLRYNIGKTPNRGSQRDWYAATALTVRDRIVDTWTASAHNARARGAKRVAYFSLEFLIGRLLFDAAGNLGLIDDLRAALALEGVDLDHLRTLEPDAALGNGGLGRLAACFMESMATLAIPAFGYGIRYDHGLFRQSISDGWQQELPEDWLSSGNPWEFQRPELSYRIGFGGSVTGAVEAGRMAFTWNPGELLFAVAFDTPMVGYGGAHANTLRLWSARAADPLMLDAFNRGDHVGALTDRVRAEAVSRVLYPGDDSPAGQELRLRQEYFFASASLQDMLRRHLVEHDTVTNLDDYVAIQLNDTHPAIGIAELMRLLLDVHGLEWEQAWAITQGLHQLHQPHPAARSAGDVAGAAAGAAVAAAHADHLPAERPPPGHPARRRRGRPAARRAKPDRRGQRPPGAHGPPGVPGQPFGERRVGAAHGPDAPHHLPRPGHRDGRPHRQPHQRHHLPPLAAPDQPGADALLVDTVGERILRDPMALSDLIPYADDAGFRDAFRAQRIPRKQAVARLAAAQLGIIVDPDALFDVQIKRIHEYKRQLLNVLHAISQYNAIRAQPTRQWRPRVKFFAGKAAPSYTLAKQIIRLAHDVARVVNGDPTVRGLLQVVFMPNYNVSLAELLIPAADLSEQISTAGMEASGTGNMKLALNGALTIGTLDGANVEIRERVGADNMFIFGMTTEEVDARRSSTGLDSSGPIAACPALRDVVEALRSGVFSPEEPQRYAALADRLTHADPFFVCADFASYDQAQDAVDEKWRNPEAWWRSAVLNTANMGWFSSDRTISEYASGTWRVTPTLG